MDLTSRAQPTYPLVPSGYSSVDRASVFGTECRGFESLYPRLRSIGEPGLPTGRETVRSLLAAARFADWHAICPIPGVVKPQY